MNSILMFFSELSRELSLSLIMSATAILFMGLSCLMYKIRDKNKRTTMLHFLLVILAAGSSAMSLFIANTNNVGSLGAFACLIMLCISIMSAFSTIIIEKKKTFFALGLIFGLCVILTSATILS
jgi:hypothetical protein